MGITSVDSIKVIGLHVFINGCFVAKAKHESHASNFEAAALRYEEGRNANEVARVLHLSRAAVVETWDKIEDAQEFKIPSGGDELRRRFLHTRYCGEYANINGVQVPYHKIRDGKKGVEGIIHEFSEDALRGSEDSRIIYQIIGLGHEERRRRITGEDCTNQYWLDMSLPMAEGASLKRWILRFSGDCSVSNSDIATQLEISKGLVSRTLEELAGVETSQQAGSMHYGLYAVAHVLKTLTE